MIFLQILLTFGSLSLMGFGGGSTIIPQMHADVVDHYHWVTSAQFTQFYAIGRLAPGPNSMMCTLIGYAVAGYAGAVVTAIAMYLPAAIVVGVVGKAWRKLGDSPVRLLISSGLTPVVVGLTWASAVTIGRGAIDTIPAVVITVVATAVLLWTDINVPIVMALGAVAGLVFLR